MLHFTYTRSFPPLVRQINTWNSELSSCTDLSDGLQWAMNIFGNLHDSRSLIYSRSTALPCSLKRQCVSSSSEPARGAAGSRCASKELSAITQMWHCFAITTSKKKDQPFLTPHLWQGQEFQAPQHSRLPMTCKTGKRSITTARFLTAAPTVLLWKLPLYLRVLNEKNFFLALHRSLKHLTSFSPEMLPSTTRFSSAPFYAAPEIQGTFCSDVLMAPEIYCWDHRLPHKHPIP